MPAAAGGDRDAWREEAHLAQDDVAAALVARGDALGLLLGKLSDLGLRHRINW